FCGAKYRWTPFRLIFSALQRAPVQKYCQVQVDAVLPVKYTLTDFILETQNAELQRAPTTRKKLDRYLHIIIKVIMNKF
ncbi:MAG: hypothetical protein ABFC98_03460, partial [Candidatus Cloacimonas sp.]